MAVILEDNIPVGNTENKQEATNPISKFMVDGFHNNFMDLIKSINKDIEDVSEFGCGEGHLTKYISKSTNNKPYKGSDFSKIIIEKAKSIYPNQNFYQKSIFDATKEDAADLIVCCEVLEHLEDPEKALSKLALISKKYLILSVPREPLWRLLNMTRLKYLKDFGNTPGHLNHWSKNSFIRFVEKEFEIIKLKSPLPWTMVLVKKK